MTTAQLRQIKNDLRLGRLLCADEANEFIRETESQARTIEAAGLRIAELERENAELKRLLSPPSLGDFTEPNSECG